jgi:hypothetical protein
MFDHCFLVFDTVFCAAIMQKRPGSASWRKVPTVFFQEISELRRNQSMSMSRSLASSFLFQNLKPCLFFPIPNLTAHPTHTGFATFRPSLTPVLSSTNSLQLTGTI